MASVLAMRDPRLEAYAELIVRCLRVEPGWQVYVGGNPQAAPLLEEVAALVGERGAYALPRISFNSVSAGSIGWLRRAPLELLGTLAPLQEHELRTVDALLFVQAPDNSRDTSDVDPERLAAVRAAYRSGQLADHEPRDPVDGLPVPDGGAGAGRRALDRGVHGPPLRGGAPGLGRDRRGHAQARRPLRRCRRGANRRRRNRSASVARGAHDAGRRARREPARGRVLRLSRSRPRRRAPSPSPSSPPCSAAAS